MESRALEGVTVRRATPEDGAAVAALVLGWAEERGREPLGAASLAQAVEECLNTPGHEVWVAEAGGLLLGYAAVHWIPFPLIYGREGYLSDLLVAQAGRGRRVGSRLLAQVEARARELGCVRVLLNNARNSEAFAREFYPKQGYQERTQFANYVKYLE
jgi:GNAT superfamily N-acetyltransferase